MSCLFEKIIANVQEEPFSNRGGESKFKILWGESVACRLGGGCFPLVLEMPQLHLLLFYYGWVVFIVVGFFLSYLPNPKREFLGLGWDGLLVAVLLELGWGALLHW